MSSQSDYKLHLSHRSSDGNSTTSHQSETASMDDNDATPLAIPPPPPPRRNTSFPIREDCWSEDATFTLINAWGEKFLQLNRGNLRQKHWQAVADAVNVRHGNVKKTRRSDVQCKNRIDTLKKKYKVEKCKVLELDYVSQWPFFASLDSLIGCNFKPSTVTPTPQPPKRKRIQETAIVKSSLPALPPLPSSVPVGRRSKRPLPPSDLPSTNNSFFRRNFSLMAAAAAAIDGADVDSDSSSSAGNRSRVGNRNGNGNGNTIRWLPVETDDPYHQLAEAIGRFSEVYERVEEAKQRQTVELEKQRKQFTKDLELQRMKLLIESQVQLEKLKRLKTNSEPSFCRSNEGDHSASIG